MSFPLEQYEEILVEAASIVKDRCERGLVLRHSAPSHGLTPKSLTGQ